MGCTSSNAKDAVAEQPAKLGESQVVLSNSSEERTLGSSPESSATKPAENNAVSEMDQQSAHSTTVEASSSSTQTPVAANTTIPAPDTTNVELSNSFLSYYFVFITTGVGLAAAALDDKRVLFDAASTFYCRALTKGAEQVLASARIQNASAAFNQVEDWLVKWRHKVVMHEFCVQQGVFMRATDDGTDIKVAKYKVDSHDSVDERLGVASDLSTYRLRYFQNNIADLHVPVSNYTLTPSEPRTFAIPFPVITVRSLVPLQNVDHEHCVQIFKTLWSLLLMQDMLEKALKYIDRYLQCVERGASNVRSKALEIAYLLKASSLIYATHSSGHLTIITEVSALLGNIRAGGGHGNAVGGYFEWSGAISVDATHDEIVQHLFQNMTLPTADQVTTIRMEASTLRAAVVDDVIGTKQSLLTMIDLQNSSTSDATLPVGLSGVYLNGPKRTTTEATVNLLDLGDDDDNVFGGMFE